MKRLASLLLPLPMLGVLALLTANAFVSAKASTPAHIMVIVDENAAYGSSDGSPFIIGNTKAPYINSLASQYRSATNWFAVQHTSRYAYRELIAGAPGGHQPIKGPTLVDELANAGISWKAYIESAPGNTCAGDTQSSGNYYAGHNPFVMYSSILNTPSQCANVVPYPQSGLSSDLNSGSPPDFVWITPNQCDDMHNKCGGNPVSHGDTWLSDNLPAVLTSTWFTSGATVVITWDESVTSDTSGGSFGTGGHIATLVISTLGKTGTQFTTSGDHYGTLRGIEEAYGVGLLGNSANASFGDLGAAFAP